MRSRRPPQSRTPTGKHFKVLAKAPYDKGFVVTIPAGTYYVGDPCYALDDELYTEKSDVLFEDFNQGVCYDALFESTAGKGVVLNWGTRIGDGRYQFDAEYPQFKSPPKGLAVDSGSLAFIDKRLVKKKAGRLSLVAGEITFEKPVTLKVTPKGNLVDLPGKLCVLVDPSEFGDNFPEQE
jgi:hypothetical protein